MDAKTAVEKMRNKYQRYIKLDVWQSESARLMQLECDEIADFIEQQANDIAYYKTKADDKNIAWKEKYEQSCVKRSEHIEELLELRGQVEQQTEQIENMKCRTNCKHGGSGIHWCKINECVGCNLWELAGGSGE